MYSELPLRNFDPLAQDRPAHIKVRTSYHLSHRILGRLQPASVSGICRHIVPAQSPSRRSVMGRVQMQIRANRTMGGRRRTSDPASHVEAWSG